MRIESLIRAVLVLLISFNSALAQDEYASCKQELRRYMKEISRVHFPSGNKVYYMSMSVRTEMNPKSGIPDSESKVDIYMNASQLHYVSDALITHQDENDAFAILPQRKMIFWANGGKRPDADANLQAVNQIQDTLVTLSSVTACREMVKDGKSLKVVVLETHRRARESFKIRKIEYVLNAADKKIESVNMYYVPGEDIVLRSITYHEVNLNYSKIKFIRPVYEQVFTGKDQLVAKYKGYQLIDKRN